MTYINLHTHTEYSNLRMLDSTNKLQKVIDKAIEIGLNGVAITDHDCVSGHVKAIQKHKKLMANGSDFKIILGNEIYLVDSLEEVRDNYKGKETKFFHFILLAKDALGAEQIRRISSSAWENNFYTGKMERVPTIKQTLVEIIGEDKGHIIASSACMGGELSYWILKDDPDKCLEFIDWCQEVFLPENFYLEMQPNDSKEQILINKKIIKISEQLDVPYIITTDAHYLSADQSLIHEAYLNSREDSSRETAEFYKTCYLMTAEEIHLWMDEQIGKDCVDIALENTNKIGQSIEFFDLECPTIVPAYNVPEFELRHSFKSWYDICEYIKKFAYSEDIYDRYLLKLIEDGFSKKIPYTTLSEDNITELLERIDIELKEMWLVTEKLGTSISAYYLTTLDLVDTMWNEGDSLVGVARGSVTGMFTMYLIGITQINPLPYNLKHWRHISHSKIELSDVDLDSAANRRGKIISAVKGKRGKEMALNCCTFKTEGSKSAILTAARGMGISNDEAQFMAGLVPVTRGFTWTISDCLYGNAEEERKPVVEFANELGKYEGLLETALAIEGIVCGRSIHASAVYLFNDNFNKHNAMMKAPNGIPITQFNMKDSDYCSGLKEDLLTVKALDKIRLCMDLLIEAGHMKWQGNLRETYNKYLHPDVLDYDTKEMWDMVGRNDVTDLFQFDTTVGVQAIKKIKPRSLIELATASSIMRLMVSGGNEQPLDTYIRYKNDINEWYKCMKNDYHLTDHEISIMEKYLLDFYGVGATQEDVMTISMDKEVSDFDVKTSNLLRKGISKKDKDLQHQMKTMFFDKGQEIGTSYNLLNYVWEEVVGKQLGYSFSINHTTPYAAISLQELNLAYHYPIVYWNTACLSINAGADESVEDNKSTNYGKVGVAISRMQDRGINVALPLINESRFDFYPDEKHNRIIYALKAMNGIGDDVARAIVENRPYKSIEDFCMKMIDTKLVTTAQMIKLIKGGCFTELHNKDRKSTMDWFLRNYVFTPCKSLTMQQFAKMQEMNIIPDSLELAIKMVNFKKYVLDDSNLHTKHIDKNKKMVKRGYHDGYYTLDENSQPFFTNHFTENSIVGLNKEFYLVSEKLFTKEVDGYIQPLKDWFAQEDSLNLYNETVYKELWNKHANGTVPHWSMESLTYYDDQHELADINNDLYGITNFFELPEEPEVYDYYTRYIGGEAKSMPKFKISRIAGVVLDNNSAHHSISLLTPNGVVIAKFSKGQFAFYNKQISAQLDESSDKKTVLEKSWFRRGSLLCLQGIRRGDQFVPMVYKDTIYKHTVNLIQEVYEDGTMLLQTERVRVDGIKE